ncbi:MAG: hypothetical protein QOJ19_4501 [Acidimicrobiia bacterium]|nr:hypothetical protein [Acidimicrobiia bacterium]
MRGIWTGSAEWGGHWGVGLVACTQRAEAAVIGGALRALSLIRFALASLDLSSYRMALGITDGVDLSHLTADLSIQRPGCGLWLDPTHPTIRVARVAWWSDVTVARLMLDHAEMTMPLGQLVEAAATDAEVRVA